MIDDPSPVSPEHNLQNSIIPDERGNAPEYEQRNIPEAGKRGRLRPIATRDGAGESLRIHRDVRVLAGLFDGPEVANYPLAAGRLGYVQLARGALCINGVPLSAGDGAMLSGEPGIDISGGTDAEVLVFDLPAD